MCLTATPRDCPSVGLSPCPGGLRVIFGIELGREGFGVMPKAFQRDSGDMTGQEQVTWTGTEHARQVTILLCTHNGAAFLSRQLASLRSQTHRNWRLVVSDDGSTDGSREICAQSIDGVNPEIRDGPRQGACRNFMSLITDPRIEGEYFAYCDQDDVWYPDKLERAIGALAMAPPGKPAMYCSRTRLVAADGSHLGHSQLHARAPHFRNALVENIASGNTIVLNKPARELLIAAGVLDVVLHDWWTYLLVSGAGGMVCFDPAPTLDYRQHANNVVGMAPGFGWARLQNLFQRKFSRANSLNSTALQRCRHLLSPENCELLDAFISLKTSSLINRLRAFRRAGLYKQTILGQIWLNTAVALRLV
jgi:glycosyltransferase involved in cell wall biosynthesis